MRSFQRIAAALLISGAFVGCSSPPEVKYYSLRGEAPVKRTFMRESMESMRLSPGPAATAPVILVEHFAIDDAYASERLAYRQGEHELGYDPYSLWAGSPQSQVEDLARDVLWNTLWFSDVRQPTPLSSGRGTTDLVVAGRVARLEEIDTDEVWKAGIDVELYLLDGKTREVLLSRRYANVDPVEKRNPRAVVADLSRMLEGYVNTFVIEAKPQIEAHKKSGS